MKAEVGGIRSFSEVMVEDSLLLATLFEGGGGTLVAVLESNFFMLLIFPTMSVLAAWSSLSLPLSDASFLPASTLPPCLDFAASWSPALLFSSSTLRSSS